jgi:hypothetical protein
MDLKYNRSVARITAKHPDAVLHLNVLLEKVEFSVFEEPPAGAQSTPYADLQRTFDTALTAMQELPGVSAPLANIMVRGIDRRLSVLSDLLDSAGGQEIGIYHACLRILGEFVRRL